MMSSPTSPSATGLPGRVDDGEVPAVERQADADRTLAVQQRGAGDDGRLGGAVGVPHLAAVDGEPFGQFGRACLAAEDQQAHVLEAPRRPQRRERRHGRDDGDAAARRATGRGPCRVRTSDARAREPGRRRAATRATSPRTTRRTRPRARPARGRRARAGRPAGTAGPRHRRTRRLAMVHRDALGDAGGAGGEDDPRVVVDGRRAGARRLGPVGGGARGDPVPVMIALDLRLAEHELGALLGVVRVDRHVGGAGGEHRQDRDVERAGSGRHPDADAVAGPDARLGQRPPRSAGSPRAVPGR